MTAVGLRLGVPRAVRHGIHTLRLDEVLRHRSQSKRYLELAAKRDAQVRVVQDVSHNVLESSHMLGLRVLHELTEVRRVVR